jgi:hypothetical protein
MSPDSFPTLNSFSWSMILKKHCSNFCSFPTLDLWVEWQTHKPLYLKWDFVIMACTVFFHFCNFPWFKFMIKDYFSYRDKIWNTYQFYHNLCHLLCQAIDLFPFLFRCEIGKSALQLLPINQFIILNYRQNIFKYI